MEIVITGSLGHISRPLTEMLVGKQHKVKVITSNPEREAEIRRLGAVPVVGSIDDAAFLAHAFAGADAAYCMTPPNFSVTDQQEYYERSAGAYASAIRSAGVRRVLYLSSYGAHLPSGTGYITGSYKAEQIFNTLTDVSLTHIRPGFFYYNFLGFIPMIKAAGFMGAVYGESDKLAVVSPVDIASAVAAEITQADSTDKVRYVYSEDLTCNEAAAILGRAIGLPDLQWKILPEEQVLQALMGHGLPKNAAENLVELGKAVHTGILREDFDQNKPEPGIIKLEDYAAEFAAAYNKQ